MNTIPFLCSVSTWKQCLIFQRAFCQESSLERRQVDGQRNRQVQPGMSDNWPDGVAAPREARSVGTLLSGGLSKTGLSRRNEVHRERKSLVPASHSGEDKISTYIPLHRQWPIICGTDSWSLISGLGS